MSVHCRLVVCRWRTSLEEEKWILALILQRLDRGAERFKYLSPGAKCCSWNPPLSLIPACVTTIHTDVSPSLPPSPPGAHFSWDAWILPSSQTHPSRGLVLKLLVFSDKHITNCQVGNDHDVQKRASGAAVAMGLPGRGSFPTAQCSAWACECSANWDQPGNRRIIQNRGVFFSFLYQCDISFLVPF